jgi:protein arginine kinase
MNLLSLLRLGVDLGMLPAARRSLVDELFLVSQPAHLQLAHPAKEKLGADERDLFRADQLRARLAGLEKPDHTLVPLQAPKA